MTNGPYEIFLGCALNGEEGTDHIRAESYEWIEERLVCLASVSEGSDASYVRLTRAQCLELATYLMEKAMHP